MNVLIKDMKKPKSCYAIIDGDPEYCPFVNTDDDCVLLLKKGKCEGTWKEQYSKCPLVEIPGTCEDVVCRHEMDESKLRARLKFCEYCNEDSDGYVKPMEKNGHAFIGFGMNGLVINLRANGWHGECKIRYCPMCGRDLFVK